MFFNILYIDDLVREWKKEIPQDIEVNAHQCLVPFYFDQAIIYDSEDKIQKI